MEYYLSPAKYKELQDELENLKSQSRTEVAEDLRRAKEYGDLSENSEYAEARQRQSVIEARIFELEDLLKKANIVEKSGNGEHVEIGSTITVKKNGKEFTYHIVGFDESKPEENKISNDSPLGRAFMGKKSGDEVEVKTPTGISVYKIISVK